MESDLLESSVESRSDPTVLRPGGRRVAIRDSMISVTVTLAVRFAAESEPYRDSVHRQPPAEAGPGGQQAPAFNSDSEPGLTVPIPGRRRVRPIMMLTQSESAGESQPVRPRSRGRLRL